MTRGRPMIHMPSLDGNPDKRTCRACGLIFNKRSIAKHYTSCKSAKEKQTSSWVESSFTQIAPLYIDSCHLSTSNPTEPLPKDNQTKAIAVVKPVPVLKRSEVKGKRLGTNGPTIKATQNESTIVSTEVPVTEISKVQIKKVKFNFNAKIQYFRNLFQIDNNNINMPKRRISKRKLLQTAGYRKLRVYKGPSRKIQEYKKLHASLSLIA